MYRLFSYFRLCLLVLATAGCYGQSALHRPVTLDAGNEPLSEVLARLEKNYGIPFAYFQQQDLLQKKVTIRVTDVPLDSVLTWLFARTAIAYRLVGNQIVLRDAPGQPPAYLTVRGTVLDQQTGRPLPYAAVSLKGRPIGTVTNPAGEFTFHVPDRYADDTLVISFVGYAPFRETVRSTHGQSDRTFRLSPRTVALDEVVVADQPLTAREIVQTAIARIKENYPTEPYIMEGFYRDWTKSRMSEAYAQQYGMPLTASLLEAAVSVYDKGYASKGGRQVYVQEIRRSQDLPGNWTVPKGLNLGLEGDFVRNNRAMGNFDMVRGILDFPNEMAYSLLDTVTHNGESLYRIRAQALPGKKYNDPALAAAHYQLYISREDFTILQIDLKSTVGGNNPAEPSDPVKYGQNAGPKDGTNGWTCTMIDNTLQFRRYQGKAYPSYLRTHHQTRRVASQTESLTSVGHEFFRELLINDLHTEGVAERHRQLGKKVHQHQRLDAQLKPYNPAFWAHYNLIRDNPLDAELVGVLGQQKPLEKQFTESPPATGSSAKRKTKRQ